MAGNVEKLGKALVEFEEKLNATRDELDGIANDLLVLAEELVVEIRNEAVTAYQMARDKINKALDEEIEYLRKVYEERIKDEVSKIEKTANEKFEEAVSLALEMIRGAMS